MSAQDIKKIEELIEIIYGDLKKEGGRFKVSELLKAIEMKRKLAPTDDREKQFWSMINGIRRDTLAQKHTKPTAAAAHSAGEKSSHAK